ncbi:unnamed protein product [Paramecium primaurelia]|uniref:Uncharacterized protein n=1 Tax=Paramecium primaurelia TaxID=5886 RepID=A0A8S1K7V7_PARPR|nr:unnamed protein product [Paramecium primaurelia]
MLPIVYATSYINYPQLNLQQVYPIPTQYYNIFPTKVTCDQACQFPEITLNVEASDNTDSNNLTKCKEALVLEELNLLLRFLSKNISLLQEKTFEKFVIENLKNLISLHCDIPNILKRRYIQVNKTKEEMTKFIIRRCFDFIKTQINYQEKDNLGAEERDRLFYHTFFSNDKEFMKILGNDSIDDLIPFRKESKLKTINDTYLKKLFKSKYFSYFYQQFLNEFQTICQQENEEKIEKMTMQIQKIIFTRDYDKIKTYRRFPWKNHEFHKCEKRAQEIYQKYQFYKFKNEKKLLKKESIKLEHIELSESIQ